MQKDKNNIPNYSKGIQTVYLEMFLSDAATFIRCQNVFDPENFDRTLQETASFIKDYVDTYKVMPDAQIVNASCKMNLNPVVLPEENYLWLLDEFEQFSRHKGLERAISKSVDLLEKGDYGPVEKMIKDAVQISLQKDLGTDYFEDPRARLEHLKNSNGQISTGWPSVDKKLFGGMNRGELNIFCAGSGGGKSLFLANLACNWALAGLNVVYFTFELSEDLVSMRMDSMLTGFSTREIFKNLNEVELKVKMFGKKSGGIQIKYLPSGKTCIDLRSYLKEYQIKKGKKPDVILVDYLDLMMPTSVKISPSDLFVKDKYVSEELRNLAMETKTIFVTASQLNRAAVEEIEFDHSHIAGGLSKIMTADNVIGIFTSRAMKERGRYQIQFMKTRSSSGVGQKVELEFDLDSLRIRDLGEQEESSAPKPSIYDTLKKTSSITINDTERNPVDGINIGKIKATGTSKIRELIESLNSEKDD